MSRDSNLDRALVSGIAWTAILRWSAQGVSWIATFLAARLLLPADYGIVSMATLGIGFLRMVEDFGLDSILVQDRSIQGREQARLAGLILATGVVFCLAFLALAHSIAGFFKEPQVAGAIAALSLLFVTDALQVVPRAALQRNLEFRRFAALTLVQVVATQVVLIASAAGGWGFWSLVASSLAGAIAVTVTLIVWRPYAVAWPRELASLARPLLQGWRVIAGRIAYYFFTSGDQWIVGRMLGKESLGIYNFAQTFGNLPLQEVTAIVSRVVPGVFSESQQDRAKLRHYFLLLTRFVACLTVPLAIGLALTADLVVHLALGPKWEGVIAPLRLLCLYAAFQGCQVLVAHVLMWTGRFRAIMWCTVLAAVVMPAGFYLAAGKGLVGIAVVWVVLYPIANMPALILGLQTVSVSIRGWLAALSPSLFAALAMTVAVLVVRRMLPAYPVPVTLALVSGSGALVYAAVLWLAFRRETLEMVNFVRNVRTHGAPTAPAPANP